MQICGKKIDNSIFDICITKKQVSDHFEPNFLLLYIIEGTLSIKIENKYSLIDKNTYIFVNKNHLAKLEMIPDHGGYFRAIYVLFRNEYLQSLKLSTFSQLRISNNSLIDFNFKSLNTSNILLDSYFKYLRSILDKNHKFDTVMESLKLLEAIYILIRIDRNFENYFFCNQVHNKIDLVGFMNNNFQFNIPLTRFAELTGRSLSSFKRDFQVTFKTTPSKWLLDKRLCLSFQLLQEGHKPGDIYLNIGFESFSHFSKCFKDKYGLTPRTIKSNIE